MIQVAVGILRRGDKLLVSERPADKPYSGYWEFPGGKIEAGETGEAALKRELHEELGIVVNEAAFWFSHHHDYPDKSVVLEMWLVDDFNGEPESRENQVLRWVTYTEMLSLRLLEGNLPIMNRLQSLIIND